MKHFFISGSTNEASYISILNETEDGYMIRIYRDMDGYEEKIDEFMPKNLFESCLRTGYIVEMNKDDISAIA